MITLIEINKKISESVDPSDILYWTERRYQFYEEGIEAVNSTIEDDICEGFYPNSNLKEV